MHYVGIFERIDEAKAHLRVLMRLPEPILTGDMLKYNHKKGDLMRVGFKNKRKSAHFLNNLGRYHQNRLAQLQERDNRLYMEGVRLFEYFSWHYVCGCDKNNKIMRLKCKIQVPGAMTTTLV